MLVANRDPFHAGSDDVRSAPGAIPRLSRAMSVLQIAGTLLAIPVGLGSAYSMYRANFSVDATCQSLRTNIIAIIDKKIDAGTRRMLVRRDVESFEKSCGGFDPDAEAAFKTILVADKAPAAAPPKVHADAPPKVAAHKAEPHPALAAKTLTAEKPAANTGAVAAEAEPVRTEAAVPDDKWLDAVRNALVTSEPEPVTPVSVKATDAPPVARLAPSEIHVVDKSPAAVAIVTPPAPPMTLAPEMPPGTAIAVTPVAPVNPDHPVPPASIPEVTSSVAENNAPAEPSSRFGWVAHIPLLGRALR